MGLFAMTGVFGFLLAFFMERNTAKSQILEEKLRRTQDDQLQSLMEAALSTETYGPESIEAFHDYLVEKCYGYGVVEGPINIVHSDKISDVALDIRNQILPGACTYAK